jgi:hypothetical protein
MNLRVGLMLISVLFLKVVNTRQTDPLKLEEKHGPLVTIPAISHNPRLTVFPSTTTFALKLSNTVGT